MTASLPPAIRFQPLVAGAPIPGGKVYFYAAGTLTLQAVYAPDGTTPLTNPLILDANGATQFRLGTGLSYKVDVTLADDTPILGWPQDLIEGTDGYLAAVTAVYTALAAPTGASLIGDKASFTGAVAFTQADKNSLTIWAKNDCGATGDGVSDDTAAINKGIAALVAAGGGRLLHEPGTYLGNWTIPDSVTFDGLNQGAVTWSPYINDHVFKTSTSVSTVHSGIENGYIHGNSSFAAQDGVHLEAGVIGTWVDTFTLRNVKVDNCGRYGIRVRGTSTAGPFVQRLRMDNVESRLNVNAGLSIAGACLEFVFTECAIATNGGTANNNMEIVNDSGSVPSRVNFVGTIHDASVSYTASGTKPAVWVDGASCLTFLTCDFESAAPWVSISNSVYNENINFISPTFQGVLDAVDGVSVTRCKNLVLENPKVFILSGKTLTNFVNTNGSGPQDITGFRLVDPLYNGTITNIIADTNGFWHTLASDTGTAWRTIQRVHAETGTADDLATINGVNGGTKELVDGQLFTVHPFSGDTITVKHNTGNIFLTGAADYVMASEDLCVTLRWDIHSSKWSEVGRV